ncbi:MAG: aminoglycoside 6-adenylyltransferase [Xanthobacteraceae bacterium]
MRNHIERTERTIKAVVAWAAAHNAVRAVALVGSRARGAARPDSDIDLVLLVVDAEAFRADHLWLDVIAWKQTGVRPLTWRDVQYGDLWSRHVRIDDGLEVEFSFAPLSWANCAPLNTGTKRVISDGCRALYDPDALLAALMVCVSDADPRIL